MHVSMSVHSKWAKCDLCRATIDIPFAHKIFTFSTPFKQDLICLCNISRSFLSLSLGKPVYCTHILIFIMHILLNIFLSVFSAACTNAQGTWYYPDPNTVPIFNNVDVVNTSWSVPATSSGSAFLWLWCTPNGTVSYTLGEKAKRCPCEQAG